jgi:hypothetical protein
MLGRPDLSAYAIHLGKYSWLGSIPRSQFDERQFGWQGLGTGGVPIYAMRNGFLLFNFPESDVYAGGAVPNSPLIEGRQIPPDVLVAREKRNALQYARFAYINATVFALYSAYTEVQKTGGAFPSPADPMNYFKATFIEENKWTIIANTREPVEFPVGETCMQVETFESAIKLLVTCERHLGDGHVELLNLAQLALHQYRSHQFSSAHITAWCIAESMLQWLWRSYQQACTHTQITRNRKDMLNGRDYSASSVSQILSLAGALDDDLLDQLDSARRARNAFAHSLSGISADQAGKAIRCAGNMISKVIGMPVHTQLSYGMYD